MQENCNKMKNIIKCYVSINLKKTFKRFVKFPREANEKPLLLMNREDIFRIEKLTNEGGVRMLFDPLRREK